MRNKLFRLASSTIVAGVMASIVLNAMPQAAFAVPTPERRDGFDRHGRQWPGRYSTNKGDTTSTCSNSRTNKDSGTSPRHSAVRRTQVRACGRSVTPLFSKRHRSTVTRVLGGHEASCGAQDARRPTSGRSQPGLPVVRGVRLHALEPHWTHETFDRHDRRLLRR